MNDTFLSDLKQVLNNCISETDSVHWMFCNNPASDFSRDRKDIYTILPAYTNSDQRETGRYHFTAFYKIQEITMTAFKCCKINQN